MKQAIKKFVVEFTVLLAALSTMISAVYYFGRVVKGPMSWIGFAIFMLVWIYVFRSLAGRIVKS